MILVEEWIKETREERTKHLLLGEECIERGGNSTVHRGCLAEYLNTNLPSKIDLCHACHNDKCSNPKHLYWGTRKENVADSIANGKHKGPFFYISKKIGYEAACANISQIQMGNKNGLGNIGTTKTEAHKKKISDSLKGNKNRGCGETGSTHQT